MHLNVLVHAKWCMPNDSNNYLFSVCFVIVTISPSHTSLDCCYDYCYYYQLAMQLLSL